MYRNIVCMGLLLVILSTSAFAQLPEIEISVTDTFVCPSDTIVVLNLTFANYIDTVAGFNVWLQLDRPDIMLFGTDPDTVIDTTLWFCESWDGPDCVDSLLVTDDTLYFQCNEWDAEFENCLDSTLIPLDSILYGGWDYDFFHEAVWDWVNIDTLEQQVGTFDISGTLIEDWDWVDARSISGYGTDLNVVGIADLPGEPHPDGIFPQPGGTLIRMPMEIIGGNPGDTVLVLIQDDFLSHCCFYRPDGSCIDSFYYEEVVDTSCYVCLQWVGEICLNWKRVSVPPPEGCDSIAIGLDTIIVFDSSIVVVNDGMVVILDPVLGDINSDGSDINIADLVYLVTYMFNGGPPPLCRESTDCDGNGVGPDIADLVCWVNWMFPPD